MKRRALIVEDDPTIIHLVTDALASLEHEFDTACSQEEALRRLAERDYSYVLLGIKIPARSQNGVARIQNAENLLEKIGARKSPVPPPVILMSDYAVEGLEETVDVMRLAMSLGCKGAVDIIAKPFPIAGRTLDRVIKKVLAGEPGCMKFVTLPLVPITHPNGVTGRGKEVPRSASPASPASAADGNGDGDTDKWMTVTQAAELLMHDLPGLDLAKARSRISTAAGRKEFRFLGERRNRRIEPHMFNTWRLKQRDKGLDAEDEDDDM